MAPLHTSLPGLALSTHPWGVFVSALTAQPPWPCLDADGAPVHLGKFPSLVGPP